jgi:c-di-GMP-binding flagellar brake protein YcgR
MAEATGSDRRNFVRISADIPVRLMAPCSAAFACDMSTGGIGIIVRDSFPLSIEDIRKSHEPMRLEIDLPDGETVTVSAEVAWWRMEEEGTSQVMRLGLRFVNVSPAVKRLIEGFLKEKAFQLAFPETPASSESDGA